MSDLIDRQAAIDECLKGKTEGLPATNVACDCCAERIRALPSAQPGWIPCSERLPENANHPGKFCPRYQVMTKYGVTEGWYNPDEGCWYALMWFLCGRLTEEYDIDFVRGDIPKVVKHVDVIAWMPLPEPYREEEEDGTVD